MNEDEKKPDETEVTPEGAVEVKEEDLDKAEGGISSYSYDLKTNPLAPSNTSLKQSPTLTPTDQNYDLKKI